MHDFYCRFYQLLFDRWYIQLTVCDNFVPQGDQLRCLQEKKKKKKKIVHHLQCDKFMLQLLWTISLV